MSALRQWMPLYIGDYLQDTRHLTTRQHGAYLLLIFHYWTTGGLPDDEAQLARITQLSVDEWRRDRGVLRAFFHDGWHHKRLDHQLRQQHEAHMRRVAAGSKGGTVASINRFRRR
jgi:uncharacterized protein YdaU (DUF1376 family)